jgi:hypothetical protein
MAKLTEVEKAALEAQEKLEAEKVALESEKKPEDKNPKPGKEFLEPKEYKNETFDKVKVNTLIKGQFKNCTIDTLILSDIKTLKIPFFSCKIKKVIFEGYVPMGIETHGAFFGQNVEEVTIPKQYEKLFSIKKLQIFGNIKKINIT